MQAKIRMPLEGISKTLTTSARVFEIALENEIDKLKEGESPSQVLQMALARVILVVDAIADALNVNPDEVLEEKQQETKH